MIFVLFRVLLGIENFDVRISIRTPISFRFFSSMAMYLFTIILSSLCCYCDSLFLLLIVFACRSYDSLVLSMLVLALLPFSHFLLLFFSVKGALGARCTIAAEEHRGGARGEPLFVLPRCRGGGVALAHVLWRRRLIDVASAPAPRPGGGLLVVQVVPHRAALRWSAASVPPWESLINPNG